MISILNIYPDSDAEEIVNYNQFKKSNTDILECPNAHSLIQIQNNSIVNYKIYIDKDQFAKERFFIKSHNNYTYIYKKQSPNFIHRYKPILTLDYFIPLPLHNNVIQSDKLLERLYNLKAFY